MEREQAGTGNKWIWQKVAKEHKREKSSKKGKEDEDVGSIA